MKSEDNGVIFAFFLMGMGLVVLPLLFFFGGGMFSAVAIFAALTFILIFFQKRRRIIASLLVIFLEYGFFLSRIYLNPDIVPVPKGRMQVFFNYAFWFIVAAVIALIGIAIQERRFIQEKRRIEECEEAMQRFGTAKNQALEEIATEIRTPMNTVIEMTELLLKEEADNTVRSEIMHIKGASYKLLSTIDDALTYSQLEAGKAVLFPTSYHFDEMIEEIIDSVLDEMNSRKIHFLVRIAADIPKVLNGDSRRIRMTILNLLQAAISMTLDGRIILTVYFEKEAEAEEGMLVCTVADTGWGLKQFDIDTISEKREYLEGVSLKLAVCREYVSLLNGEIEVNSLEDVGTSVTFRIKNHIEDAKPIVSMDGYKIPRVLIYTENEDKKKNWQDIFKGLMVEVHYVHNRHGLEYALQNTKYEFIFLFRTVYEQMKSIIAYYHCEENTYVVGENTDVYGDFENCKILRLPISSISIARVLNGKWQKEDYLTARNQANFTVKGSKILVIDDSFVNLKVVTGIFEKYGVMIDIAISGEEGLKKIQNEKYHLILVDFYMPEMNGEEVLEGIRAMEGDYYKEIPVIAVASGNNERLREMLIEKGFQEYLAKPIKIKNIEACMLKFLPERYIVRLDKKADSDLWNDETLQEERGLNVGKGMANIGYNEDSYLAILDTYYYENKKKIVNLEDIFKKEEIGTFISAVHGIKSTSASVGAMGLSFLARELEYAGKDGKLGIISERLPLFLKEYQLILNEIEEYLMSHGRLGNDDSVQAGLPDNEQQLEAGMLENLKGKMDRMDLKSCGEIMAEFAVTNFGQEDNVKIRKLKEAYDTFDFHTAKKILNDLIESKNNVDN